MNTNYRYKNGDKVYYNLTDSIKGVGFVRGIASNDNPVIGVTYIIEDVESAFPNTTYPYSHFVAFECMLKPFNEHEDDKIKKA